MAEKYLNKYRIASARLQTWDYDVFIRDDRAFETISNYIINNPAKW